MCPAVIVVVVGGSSIGLVHSRIFLGTYVCILCMYYILALARKESISRLSLGQAINPPARAETFCQTRRGKFLFLHIERKIIAVYDIIYIIN